MGEILKVEKVTKKFEKTIAVNDLSLSVKAGEIYVLIGPNGSGKTTLENCVVGLLRPDSGRIDIKGISIEEYPVTAKKEFAYISDNPQIYPYLSGEEFIKLNGRLRGLSVKQINNKYSELEKIFPIKNILREPAGNYSRGNIEKTAILSSLISNPSLLVIDEPIVGLDPLSITILGKTLREYTKNGGAVLLSTHTLSFAKEYADKIGVLKKGVIIKEFYPTKKTNLSKIYKQLTQDD